jgi:hypothetical protein
VWWVLLRGGRYHLQNSIYVEDPVTEEENCIAVPEQALSLVNVKSTAGGELTVT